MSAKKKTVTARKLKPATRIKRSPYRDRVIDKTPQGYKMSKGNIYVPNSSYKPVKSSKLVKGVATAKKEIQKVLDELMSTMTGNYVISEIELSATFSADGKFMGFGLGGATTMTIRIRPE